jgi:hypothetical protein
MSRMITRCRFSRSFKFCMVCYKRVTPMGFWNVAFGPWGYKRVTPMGFSMVSYDDVL